jgi:methyl-accepting chemotaxis protein
VIARIDEVASVIAFAVEQQASTTREIAVSVQTMTQATRQAAAAMQDVSSVSESAGKSSLRVLAAASDLGATARVLGEEVRHFLHAMARSDEQNRRRYERIPGREMLAVLHVPGGGDQRVVIQDISRGGAGVRSQWCGRVGEAVEIDLPGASAPVAARVVRSGGGVLALSFQQNDRVLRLVDQAMEQIETAASPEAA